jgi:hypothetical protein
MTSLKAMQSHISNSAQPGLIGGILGNGRIYRSEAALRDCGMNGGETVEWSGREGRGEEECGEVEGGCVQLAAADRICGFGNFELRMNMTRQFSVVVVVIEGFRCRRSEVFFVVVEG